MDEQEAGGGEDQRGDGVTRDAEWPGEKRFFFSEDENPDGGGCVEGVDGGGGIEDGIDEGAQQEDEEESDSALGAECCGGRLEFRVPLAESLEGRVVLADGIGDAGAGEDEAIDGTEGGDTDEEADQSGAEVWEESGYRIGGDGVGVAEAGVAESVDEGEIGEEVEQSDCECSDDEGAGDIAGGVTDLGCHVGHFVPSAEGEEDEDEGQAEGQLIGFRGGGRGSIGLSGDEGGGDDEDEAESLGGGEEVLGPFALADAQDIDGGEKDYGAGGIDLVHDGQGGLGEGVPDGAGIGGEGEGHDRDISGADDSELGPAEEESGPGSVGPIEEDIVTSFPGEGGGEFGVAEGTEEGESSAEEPDAEESVDVVGSFGDIRRHLVDARSDDDTDNEAGGVEQAEDLFRTMAHGPSIGLLTFWVSVF